ncbi:MULTISPECIES: DUF4433 domain-containing protein [unclassified Streptomyces]|uniref:type II toxin-antitoxin system toxin DNA ADP-ribosyl transferase DarT n=1 Tax=unclassified Streptomyces TaxID=2593676 RepID=UPI003332B562
MARDVTIYHFTHIRNIPNIITSGTLFADGCTDGRMQVEVGDPAIKSRRRSLTVRKPPGGVPADYVPFYFAPRSPMMLRIKSGGVPQYQDGQGPLVYLTSTADLMAAQGIPFLFTDGNCASSLTDYYDDLADLEKVDWTVMRATMWADTADDPDRKRRRMAEFLMHQTAPLSAITGMATMTAQMADELKSVLTRLNYSTDIQIRREWYY